MTLTFPGAVQEHFAFLESDFGFSVVDLDESGVRYQHGDVVVGVFVERASLEVGAAVGRTEFPDELERPYHVAEIVGVSDSASGERYAYHEALSREALHFSLGALAGDLRRFGQPALRGDPGFFSRLAEVRARVAAQFDFDLRGRYVRSAAEAAWRASEYAKVAELYAVIEDDLSPEEAGRLREAQERSRG